MAETKKVLVVDDDEELLDVMAEVVSKLGCLVLLARNADEALMLFHTEHPPVVITDLKMPTMDGLALMRAIKNASPSTEVLIITAYADLESAIQAIRQGAFDYIPKPADFEILLHRVSNALERHRLSSERKALLATLEKAVRLLRTDVEEQPE